MSITHAYVGYNTAGGTTETMTLRRVYAKKVTLAAAGWITSIGAYLKSDGADHVGGLNTVLFEDVAGTPGKILAFSGGTKTDLFLQTAAATTAARFVHRSLSYYATAGDYWIAVQDITANRNVIHKDTSGSDRYYTPGGDWVADWGFYTPTTTSDTYSIRASLIT